MSMSVQSVSKRVLKDGTIRGTVSVRDGIHRHSVKYEFVPNSGYGWSQWGAGTDVLCFTQPTVERLIAQEGAEW